MEKHVPFNLSSTCLFGDLLQKHNSHQTLTVIQSTLNIEFLNVGCFIARMQINCSKDLMQDTCKGYE